jgi:hypothetical protein
VRAPICLCIEEHELICWGGKAIHIIDIISDNSRLEGAPNARRQAFGSSKDNIGGPHILYNKTNKFQISRNRLEYRVVTALMRYRSFEQSSEFNEPQKNVLSYSAKIPSERYVL